MINKSSENLEKLENGHSFGLQTIRALLLTVLFFISIVIYHGIGR